MIRFGEYGSGNRWVAVLHGGPGAPGSAAMLARRLGRSFHVLEPLQRDSGDLPLSVNRHVTDLEELLEARCGREPVAVVGHSWGAMLALAHGAEHPLRDAAIALVGCGSFDPAARARFTATCDARLGEDGRRALQLLTQEAPDPAERLRAVVQRLLPVYSCDPITDVLEDEPCDARAYRETWGDVLRLQDEGVHPAAFARIEAPVLMIHGAHDPHPGRMIHASLAPHMQQLSYHELASCGHYPWLERQAADEFYRILIRWLDQQLG